MLVVLLITETVETREDDSQLVSYLLAKLQKLESKIAGNSNIRNTREVQQKLPADKKSCPPIAVTYIRWGNSTCECGAITLYSGFAGGGRHDHQGSPANLLCLLPNPQYYSPSSSGSYYVYGVEYQISGVNSHADDRNMPCALCQVNGASSMIMIPSRYECPDGWRKEYHGYVMAGQYNQVGSSMYNCIDKNLEQIPGSGSNNANSHYLYTIYAQCGYFMPCGGNELSCVVCTY